MFFFFFYKIGKVVIIEEFFLIIVHVCHFTNIEFEKNPTLISQLFMLNTFDNSLLIFTCSLLESC